MLKKNGVVALTLMALQHSYTRQEKHGHVKHLRLRLVTGRNVSSHTEFINIFQKRLASVSCSHNHGAVCAKQIIRQHARTEYLQAALTSITKHGK